MKITRSLTKFSMILLVTIFISACSREPNFDAAITPLVFPEETPGASIQSSNPASPLYQITGTLAPKLILTVPITVRTEESEQPTSMPEPAPQGQGVTGLVNIAIHDLAGRLDISQEDIQLVQFEAVVWPDGSYGCPQPGVEYPQVQREGYRIQLRLADRMYIYHGGESREPFLCEQ